MSIKDDAPAWARLKTVLQAALEEPPDITVSTASDDLAFDGKIFNDILQYIVTPNTGTDEQNADYAFFVGRPDLGKVRVHEFLSAVPNTGSIELWGRVGSLIPTEFRNATGGASSIPSPPRPSRVSPPCSRQVF